MSSDMKYPIINTYVEIPKSLLGALSQGGKRWELVFAFREFGAARAVPTVKPVLSKRRRKREAKVALGVVPPKAGQVLKPAPNTKPKTLPRQQAAKAAQPKARANKPAKPSVAKPKQSVSTGVVKRRDIPLRKTSIAIPVSVGGSASKGNKRAPQRARPAAKRPGVFTSQIA